MRTRPKQNLQRVRQNSQRNHRMALLSRQKTSSDNETPKCAEIRKGK
jgi:hypothetical protein